MKEAIWSRVGPAAGLLFFPVLMVGFAIHRYPDIRPSDSQLAKWLSSVDATSFRLGVYIESIGVVLFALFAAWLYIHLRQGARDASWPAVAIVIGAAAWVALTLPVNESWVGLVDQARKGLDIRVAQTVVSINQAWFDMTGIVLGVTLIAAGVAIVRGRAMSRWVGSAAILIGVFQVVSSPLGTDSTPLSLLAYLWFLSVGGYYTFRPARARELVASAAQRSVTAGLPTG